MNYWPLAGIAIVVAGFALRFNPLLVVVTAAQCETGLGCTPPTISPAM